MKTKCVILLILTSVVSMLFSVGVVSESSLQVISQNSGQIKLRLQTPPLELKDEGSFQSLKMPGAELTADDGMPALPMFSTFVAIPARGDFSVSVQSGNYTTKSGIIPKPVFATEEQEAKGDYNLSAYSNSLYPAKIYLYSPAQIIRDFRVVQLNLFPVQYDGATQSLRICSDMTVEITMNSSSGENELPDYSGYAPAFTNLYESMISNFDAYRDTMMAPANPRILLIHGNSTDSTFLAKLNEFVTWKRQKGYEVNVTSTAMTGGSSNTAIKTYIQNQYNNQATRPDFIILLGDVTGSYAIPAFTETMSSYGGEGDYPYTHLAGTDLLGDVFIGRISAENISQLDVLFSKIYTVEKNVNTNPAAAAWLNRVLLIGDPSSSGVSTRYVNLFIKEMAKNHNPDYTFLEEYASGYSTAINSGINQGVGFYNYRGYNNMSGWSPGNSLANGVKLPHATILTCGTGNYASGTGTSEALMRLGTSASPAGSVTAIGMATIGTHTMFNNCLNSGIYEGIFINNMRSMGEALLNGRLYIKEIYGATNDTQANYFAHWCNLMGDPTVEVWTGIPGALTLTAPVTLPIGTNVVDVQLSDALGNPAKNICVTAYSSAMQAIVAKGFTDDAGNLSLTISGGLQSDVLITASAHNYKPVQQTVAADGEGSLVFVTKQIIDSGAMGSIGNNDGYADAGETIAVGLELKNTTSAAISAVTATISSDDPFVTIISNQSSFNSFAAGETQSSLSNYTFSIASNIPANHDIRFSVAMVDGGMSQYSCVFHISAYNANLFIANHTVSGGGNNILDPAENGFLQIGVKNQSVFGIQDIYAELRSLNDLVTVTDSVSFVGNISAGAISNSIDGFEVVARALLIPGMQMPMRVRLYNNSGFEQIAEFNIPVGQVNMHTPLGPDAYGYFIYDMSDTDFTDCPSYDWIEINPSLGGAGTQIPGYNDQGDSGSSPDEGDQPGSVVLKTLDLPFSFPFYGESYNQITVCANGFIALGITGNGEFRNYRMPGGYGPSPMIAAFWDDLILISDAGIYKYYDAAEHRFIVQYHKLRNGYNRTSLETFQVIFYDPLYYPTSMGDAMIKIQYKDFNNVDVGGGGYTPKHGNYATIGIKDHTNTRGLEYTYNNQYPLAAAPLASGKALLITTAPVLHENAFLVVDNVIVSDLNANGIAEPGETIELGVKLLNLGMNTAQGVTIVATTNSDYASLGNSVSAYSDILGDTSGINLSAIVLQIDLDCPDGIVIPVNCAVTIAGNSWQYPLSITVHKPVIQVSGLLMNDSMGNGNGLIDPGESVELIVNYTNNSSLEAKNITSNIMCLSQYVTIANPSLLLPGIPSGTTCQAVYAITISPDVIVGNNLTFYLTYLGDLVTAQNEQLVLSVGTTGMNEDFEANNGNFVANPTYNGWEWGVSSVVGA
ncbi:MAG: C25 family cysteine peptidase, partial [Candidatus Cloacimonas sp.]|nr:C25 family cysteine peptidase [Candidatus Cloacimonas sp.]